MSDRGEEGGGGPIMPDAAFLEFVREMRKQLNEGERPLITEADKRTARRYQYLHTWRKRKAERLKAEAEGKTTGVRKN